MKRELLIGIAGVKGVGKSTVASMLAEMIPDIIIFAWADALKSEVSDMIGQFTGERPSRDDMEALKAEVYGPLFQGWGAYRRREEEDYWIKAWERERPTGARCIIPDTRHFNEVEHLKDNGGTLIFINGPSHWEGDVRSSQHESERHVPELKPYANFFIWNDSTMEDLRSQVDILAQHLLKADEHARVAA